MDNISPADQEAIFDESLEDKLTFGSATTLLAWHADIKPVLKIAIRDYEKQSVDQTRISFKQKAKQTKECHRMRYLLQSNTTTNRSPQQTNLQAGQVPSLGRNTDPDDNNNPT